MVRRTGLRSLVLVFLCVVVAGCTGMEDTGTAPSPSVSGSHASSPALTSSGDVGDGLRCTLTIPHGVVSPGARTRARFTIENVTDHSVKVFLGTNGATGWLVFAQEGKELQDSSLAHAGIIGPAPLSRTLRPGKSVRIGSLDTAVLWPGPLEVTPHCMDTALPRVAMKVGAPGAPERSFAIERAVTATNDTFADCMPVTSGDWVEGTVHTNGSVLEARCAALVIERDGFDIVVVAWVSPPDAPEVDLSTLPDRIEAVPYIDQAPPITVSWWVFTATTQGVVCASSAHVAKGRTSESYSGGGVCHSG